MTPEASRPDTATLRTSRWKIEKFLTHKTGTIVRSSPALGALMGLLTVFSLVAFFGSWSIETTLRGEQAKALRGTLHAAVAGAELFLQGQRSELTLLARDPRVIALTDCLASRPTDACSRAAEAFVQLKETAGLPVFMADGTGKILHTTRPEALPKSGMVPGLGEPGSNATFRFIPPTRLLEGPTFSALIVPVGEGLYLGREISLEAFTRSFRAARTGETGETYAVDREGRMISESRFAGQLRKTGLLGPHDESSVLRVEIRDPGVNLVQGERTETLRSKQPLTKMALSLTQGGSGVDSAGYRDYRGVRVVGAWRWLPEYGVGVTTELDESEALQALRTVRAVYWVMLAILGVICLGSLGVGVRAAMQRKRAQAALARLEHLGQYRIEKKIGEGGMGAVYLAHHEMLRRPTALKVMIHGRDNEEAFRRFELEAQATSELTHPNTVSIFDFGRADDGTFYYAMEYLEGLDLEKMVERRGPLPEAQVLHFLYQAAGSLEEAHTSGLVHRDIKPSNLFACKIGGQEDFLKVLDFGVAKATELDELRITRASTVIGTPEYMSPEMFDRGTAVTPQSDLYSLGAVGYFLLTGRLVFGASSMAELYAAHLSEPPVAPSERVGATFDADLEGVILRCLLKDPQKRPSSAAAMRAMLRKSALFRKWDERELSPVGREELAPPPVSGERTARHDGPVVRKREPS